MKIAVIRAVKRDNYPGYYTVGRFWPSEFRAVEVVEDDADPTIPNPKNPSKPIIDQTKIGQRTLAQVQHERAFLTCSLHFAASLADVVIDPDKGVVDLTEIDAIREAKEEAARIRVEAEGEIERMAARIAELEAELAALKAPKADEPKADEPKADEPKAKKPGK